MTHIISIHSFRGGTGKSNITANVATALAMQGKRVGVVDTDIQSPGIHILFGLRDDTTVRYALNDYLYGNCAIQEAAYDVTSNVGEALRGRIFLIPSSIKPGEIARVLKESYEVRKLHRGINEASDVLKLDVLLVDTHPGLNEETLLSFAISNAVGIVMRPDQQDYQGTGVTLTVARRLKIPKTLLIVNKAPPSLDLAQLAGDVSSAYETPVAAVIPHSDEMMLLGSEGVFIMQHPQHTITDTFKKLAAELQV
jgi:septum site-determining protein MinD